MSQKSVPQLTKGRNINVQDALDQILRQLIVINMNVRIAVSEHVQPSSLINKVVKPIGLFQDGTRRARRSKRSTLILKQTLKELPAQLKLQVKLIDQTTLDKIVIKILIGRILKVRQGAGKVLIFFHTESHHPWQFRRAIAAIKTH